MEKLRVFIISDLHLGGDPAENGAGTQICSRPELISEFIDWVASHCGGTDGEEIELVLNGDVFDYLCELDAVTPLPKYWAANEDLAMRICESISDRFPVDGPDSEDSPIRALRNFLGRNGHLTITVGNHDVELSFPRVRSWLLNALQASGKRFKFVYDGEAYVCGDVLIEHGNRYDSWNAVDNDYLRRARSLMSRGLVPEEEMAVKERYEAPAGSLLVAYVYNNLKKRYRFLDLLKPETDAVIPLLLTLCPVSAAALRELIVRSAQFARRKWDARGVESSTPAKGGYLSAATPSNLEDVLQRVLGASAAQDFISQVNEVAPNSATGLGAVSDLAKVSLQKLARLSARIGDGATFAALPILSEELVLRRLHSSLKVLPTGTDFQLEPEKGAYDLAVKRLMESGNFRVVVFGHTHLPKFVPITSTHSDVAGAFYINTGTWADVIRIPDACVNPDFATAAKPLRAFAKDLANNKHHKYIIPLQCFAEISLVDGRTTDARLWRFKSARDPRNAVYD